MRDFINENETIEEKEEYQLYVWNKKKKKYVPIGKAQQNLYLCKEHLSTLSKFLNPLVYDENQMKIYRRKIKIYTSYTSWSEVNQEKKYGYKRKNSAIP